VNTPPRFWSAPAVLVACLLTAHSVQTRAQWLNYPAPGVPRLANGKVNLAAKTPRSADGKPDLSGVWHNEITPVEEWRRRLGDAAVSAQPATTITGMGIGTISIYATNLMMDLPPEQQAQLLRPAAVERMRQPQSFPSERCLPLGFPIASLLTPVTKLIQSPAMLVMLLEEGNTYVRFTSMDDHFQRTRSRHGLVIQQDIGRVTRLSWKRLV
jgi:hypothetical protein